MKDLPQIKINWVYVPALIVTVIPYFTFAPPRQGLEFVMPIFWLILLFFIFYNHK